MSRLIFVALVVTWMCWLFICNAGLLERAKQVYRDTKAKVLNEHIKPVTDSYMERAKDRASAQWERVKSRVPTFRSTQDQDQSNLIEIFKI
uniref:Apolipoprotein C-IV n=1 Tax=Cyprinus carpio carpio TaxID=630221 RepID=A0A8C1CP56_CYPCA